MGGNWDVRARLVTNLGTLFGAGPIVLANTPQDEVQVSVSRSNGGARWNIAWQRNIDLRGAQVEWNGAITTPSFAITSSGTDSNPAPSSPLPNGDYVVVFERDFGTGLGLHDILAVSIAGGSVSFPISIHGLEAAGDQAEDQRYPAIDCDGQQFAVAYQRTIGSINPQTYLTSFYVLNGAFGLSEGHINISWPSSNENQANVYAQHSAGASSQRYALSLTTVANPSGPNGGEIIGAFYDGVQGGPISNVCSGDGTGTPCPCGNNGATGYGCANSASSNGALLNGFGPADVSSDTVQLGAFQVPSGAPCLFFQGTSLHAGGNGLALGDGLLCAGGTTTRMAVKFALGTTSVFPASGDPALSIAGAVPAAGAVRYYQVWYRDSAVFCSSSTYNLTNAVKVVWLP